ncbi:fibrous sheath CABYR-binding protein-like [Apteryx mantelli]|uniref:Fibrous sheath CABYR-binding protein-like n=1 Tax=Apteryx mantelli TaxID=2696672 RepID=A0ABM4G4A4_9AVES
MFEQLSVKLEKLELRDGKAVRALCNTVLETLTAMSRSVREALQRARENSEGGASSAPSPAASQKAEVSPEPAGPSSEANAEVHPEEAQRGAVAAPLADLRDLGGKEGRPPPSAPPPPLPSNSPLHPPLPLPMPPQRPPLPSFNETTRSRQTPSEYPPLLSSSESSGDNTPGTRNKVPPSPEETVRVLQELSERLKKVELQAQEKEGGVPPCLMNPLARLPRESRWSGFIKDAIKEDRGPIGHMVVHCQGSANHFQDSELVPGIQELCLCSPSIRHS